MVTIAALFSTAGVDYTPTSVTFTFSAGNQGPMPLTIDIIDDDDAETVESFFVQLSIPAASSGLAQAGDPSISPVNIVDRDGTYSTCIHYIVSQVN